MKKPNLEDKNAGTVAAMFDEVSPRYDALNNILSLGLAPRWRAVTARALQAPPASRILDLAGGTGTSAELLAAKGYEVVVGDISEGMLELGRNRHGDNPLIEFVYADATALPFPDNSFDAATISYGLRNVSDPHQALAELRRILKPGAMLLIAEFSTPKNTILRGLYNLYSRYAMPLLSRLINRRAQNAYVYLYESIRAWPAQKELANWMRRAGYKQVAYRNLTGGIVALHRGYAPPKSSENKK